MSEKLKSLGEVNRRLRDIIRLTSDMVWEADRQHQLITISENAIDHLGDHPSELIGRAIFDIWEVAGPRSINEMPAWNKPFRNITAVRRLSDGQVRHFQLSGLPIFDDGDGSFVCIRGIAKDVTELRETEIKLLEAKEEADQANRAKTDFLSSMSHELRTPLNSILGFGQLLADDPVHRPTAEQSEKLSYILNSGRHLLDLISDVLDFANIEAGAIDVDISSIRVRDVIEESLHVIAGLATARDIEIRYADLDDIKILADPTRLRQVLLNLLSNAVKYNKQRGSVEVSTMVISDEYCRISVRDTGLGIPADQQAFLFQPFKRLGAENTYVEGTGIGLSISTNLVKLMGGEIGFTNNDGEGATFWLELPVADQLSSARKGGGAISKLLYVEDNAADRNLMARIIRPLEGVEMISAHSVEQGLSLAQSQPPDVIVLDINLPGLDSLEALNLLRSKPETRNIPVVALSFDAMPADVQRYIDAGFVEYMTKPLDRGRLRSVLNRLAAD